ncbi:hypothetical protein SRABI27_04837 [Pedobacter sp. Bi27]|uniref:hypothetical protein n=1 Tax=unclassified Pedobacter TaxID=2628915 RepID=UPI001D31BE89|nr:MULTISPECIES: hypothetical protein [unclassified Pedobacter]CAH0277473.1 hypothetical protein SRABI36_03921 [Pedobacter sp. Bi36]CAH0294640.1 hypothetical protein SRABI126_04163 [Pedobacter sp. Bi126]CAH0312296.1 hypothetical protein SRABI27_04837 [Pedobacter sp. Bi27]
MKHLYLLIITLFSAIMSLSAQQFSLPADGKWYLVAKVGGMHSAFEYTYTHTTAHTPSLVSGKFQFINSQSFAIQEHHSMGYNAWLQPQFALLNLGAESQIWVKAALGADLGTFKISNLLAGSSEMGSVSDENLNDNGGIVTTYDKIRDNAHTYVGNLNVINGSVGIGTDLPSEKLSVNGNIRAKEIKVESANWPDYVFADGYNVGTLKGLESYIKTNKHLPDMPTAKDIEADGLELGEMVKMQQKKIEELTLHLISLDKKLSTLELENRKLKVKYKKR